MCGREVRAISPVRMMACGARQYRVRRACEVFGAFSGYENDAVCPSVSKLPFMRSSEALRETIGAMVRLIGRGT